MPSQRAMWSVGDLVAFRLPVPGSLEHRARLPLGPSDAAALGEHFTHALRVLVVGPSADDTTWVYGVTCMLCPRATQHTFLEVYLCDLPERPDLVRPTLPVPSRVPRRARAERVPTPRVGDYVEPLIDDVGHWHHRWTVTQVHEGDFPPEITVRCATCVRAGRVTAAERRWAVTGLRSIGREDNPFEEFGEVTVHPPQVDPAVADREARARWEATVEAMGQVDAAVAAREQAPAPLPSLGVAPRGPKLKPGEFFTLEQTHQYILRVTLLATRGGGTPSLILEEITVIESGGPDRSATGVHRTHLSPEMLTRLVDLLGLTLPPAVKRRISVDLSPEEPT